VTNRIAAERDAEGAEPEVAARARPEAAPGMGSPAAVLALQRVAGNAAVGVLARRLREYDTWPVIADAYIQARKDREAYSKSGKKGPITYNPTSRNKKNYYGGFDVSYDPDTEELNILLKGVVDFRPGMVMEGNRAVAREGSPKAREEADKINKASKLKADREAAVKKFQWSKGGGPDAGDEATFMRDFESVVGYSWSYEHSLVCTRQYWQDLGAWVNVDVELVEQDATHKPGSPYHVQVVAMKTPPGFNSDGPADVHRAKGKKDAFSNIMTLSADGTGLRPEGLIKKKFSFETGKTKLPAKFEKGLGGFGKQMPNAPKGATAPVSDLTITVQGADPAERQARFAAVTAALKKGGMADSRLVFADGGVGNETSLTIGNGSRQVTAVHESGHMFGLDDEYTGKDDYAPGKKTEHTDFAAKVGETGIVHGSSDNIMSMGATIRRQHYVTFLDALKVVTGMEEWGFGEKQDVEPPQRYAPGHVPFSDELEGVGDGSW
jgi:hypothetical protein